MTALHADTYTALAALLDTGVTPVRALRVAAPRRRGRLRRAVLAAVDLIEEGSTFAEALADRPGVFPDLDLALVDVAERGGRVPETLRSLAQWHALTARLARRVRAGLVYPFVLVHAAAFIIPIPALVLGEIGFAGYFAVVGRSLLWVYVAAFILWLVSRIARRSPVARAVFNTVLAPVPLLGPALRDIGLARYCRAFLALYDAGVTADRCAADAARLSGNGRVRRWLGGGARAAAAGEPVSAGFRPATPADFVAVWQTGEESGRLPEVLDGEIRRRADAAETRLTEFARWLPRIVYAVVVALLAAAILRRFTTSILPLYPPL